MNGITAIEGIRVGHATDLKGITGCTVILCEAGASAGVDIRGGASGTAEIGVLDPMHITPVVHAIVLSGGSAFGLEASSGVRTFLEQHGVGFDTRVTRVPIVPAAILYDLGIGDAQARPNREMGAAAAAQAYMSEPGTPVAEGNVGAGTGATVGKINGLSCAMKGGIGTAVWELSGRFKGVKVAAIVAVNALGDVIDDRREVIAGARKTANSREFVNTARKMLDGAVPKFTGGNTTLAVVATNAKLTKVEATKLAQLSQAGVMRAISPVHTTRDGDTVFAMSTGAIPGVDINALGIAASEVMVEAIHRAVREAGTLGGVLGLKS
ncbi:P1 family peptidase [Bryobacter aggregatus]|uniref:P1 family peptidase n=1 Tax=Bryobacter aggregatus TaxID=360054 RepID=UPI0004E190E1|nr:P1 family peptidase [Bryobacter aggregatus]